ncbi:hypothetical protein NHQ30_006528 [Ciborinia camelliae]|nr:hypothetical protein NHQ30_006528 [Ciborinia camelliae]
MPYLETGKITLRLPKELGGFGQEIDYPQFYRWDFENIKIPFPNYYYIPYIEITFKTGSHSFARPPQANFESGEDTVSGNNDVRISNIPQPPSGLISDAPNGADSPAIVKPDNFAPDATEITVSDITVSDTSPTFTIPPCLFTNVNEVVSTTSFPPSMAFFEITDAVGATVTSQTTLPLDNSFKTTSTDVQQTFPVFGALVIGDPTPKGFIDSSPAF